MIKTVHRNAIEGARFEHVVTIARGEQTLTFTVGELDDIMGLLRDLSLVEDIQPTAPPTATRTVPLSPSATVAAPAPAPVAAEAPRPRPKRKRSAMWSTLVGVLKDAEGPMTIDALWSVLESKLDTSRHALRVTLGRRSASGDLVEGPPGHFSLKGDGVGSSAAAAAPEAEPAPSPDQVLWSVVRTILGNQVAPIPVDSLAREARASGIRSTPNLDEALLALLTTRLDDGDVVRSPSGRFSLKR